MRAAVDGYTGEGEPPCSCIVVTPKNEATSDLYCKPDFKVVINGIQSTKTFIIVRRLTEAILKDRLFVSRQGDLQ